MKEKILAELKKKFPGQSLHLLGLIADKLAKTVTEESKIEGAVSELENSPIPITEVGKLLQTEGDRRVTDAKKKWDADHASSNGKTGEDDEEEEDDDDTSAGKDKAKPKSKSRDRMPAWAKPMMDKLNKLETEKVQTTIRSQVKEKLGKDVPEWFWDEWALPTKEEDLDSFVQKVRDKHTAVEQEKVNKGLDGQTPPGGGGEAGKNVTATVAKNDITEWSARNKNKAAAMNGKEPAKV